VVVVLRALAVDAGERAPGWELVGGPEVLARVAGHLLPAPGAMVRLTVAGGALAYPAET
jgi:hypothetical protein